MVLMELWKSPLTFTALKDKVELSSKTLTGHLKTLLNEGLVKRKIQGKYIKYNVVKPKTVLQMRKDFLKELADLILLYDSCLNNDTHNLLGKTIHALQESITHAEPEAETDKIIRKTIKLPKGKGTVTLGDNFYEKPKFATSGEPRKRGRKKKGSRG